MNYYRQPKSSTPHRTGIVIAIFLALVLTGCISHHRQNQTRLEARP